MIAHIGPFEVYELVGRGGMGSVYRGIDPIIGRPVAIKLIRLVGYNDTQEASFLRDRLFKEARAAGRLSHPGIVTVYQVGVQDELAYIAMEFVDGPTLETRLGSAAPLEPELLGEALLGPAAALDYAHERGIVHRDIKPSNIMFTANGVTKVTDFGIAKTMLGHTTTSTGQLLGTPFYMSPEQVQGKPLDGRSDQFALAVVAYEILTRHRPFQADQVTSICYQIVHSEPTSPIDLNADLSFGVSRELRKGLKKDPADRFPTCLEFATALVDEYARSLRAGAQIRKPTQPLASNAAAEGEGAITPQHSKQSGSQNRPTAHKVTYWTAWAAAAVCILVLGAVCVHAARSFRGTVAGPKLSSAKPPTNPAAEAEDPIIPAREITRQSPAKLLLPREGRTRPVTKFPVEVFRDPRANAPPLSGRVIWRGQAPAGSLLEINRDQASNGKLVGQFPGFAVDIQVFPAAEMPDGLSVFTSKERYAVPVSESTSGVRLAFLWDPRHSTDLTIWEAPNPINEWKKLVVRVNTSGLSALVAHWRQRGPESN